MEDIGIRKNIIRYKPEHLVISEIIESEGHNHLVMLPSETELDVDNANEICQIGLIPYERWRVVGMGVLCSEASIADNDPVIEVGRRGDPNAYGTMTCVVTGGEHWNLDDYSSHDPYGVLPADSITEASATFTTTWVAGAEFALWNTGMYNIEAAEAAAGALTGGKFRIFVLIEVDSTGKY